MASKKTPAKKTATKKAPAKKAKASQATIQSLQREVEELRKRVEAFCG